MQRSLSVLRSGVERIGTYLDPGLVSLVCPAPLLRGWLQPRLPKLHALLPGLSLVLSVDESARFVDEIDVDIAISNRPLLQPGLQELPLLQDEWLLVADAGTAQKLGRIPQAQQHLHADVVCLEESLTAEDTAPLFLGPLAAFRKRAIYDDVRLVLDAVLAAQGIACLPSLLVEGSVASGQLQVLPGYPRLPGSTWWLSGVSGPARSDMVSQVFQWLGAQGTPR